MLENHFRIKIVLLVLLKFIFLNANTINSPNLSKEINIEIDANLSLTNVTVPSLTDFVTIPSLPNVTVPSLTDFVTIPSLPNVTLPSLTDFFTIPTFTIPSITDYFTIPSIPSLTDLFTIPSIPSITDFITIPTLNDLFDTLDLDNLKDSFIDDTLRFPGLSNLTFYKIPSVKDMLPVGVIKITGKL